MYTYLTTKRTRKPERKTKQTTHDRGTGTLHRGYTLTEGTRATMTEGLNGSPTRFDYLTP